MTLRELSIEVPIETREPEDTDESLAEEMLVSCLAVLRSVIQREVATNDGIAASMNEWVRQHGNPTVEKAREWIESLGPALLDRDIPDEYLNEIFEAD